MRESKTGFTFIVGNMFGFKTSEMIHQLLLERDMERNVQAFKVSWDNRYSDDYITSHNGMYYSALAVPDTSGLVKSLNIDTEVIGIDELQFFDDEMIDFIKKNKDKYMIIATALQRDFRGNAFPFRSKYDREVDSKRHVGELMPLSRIVPRYPQCTHRTDGEYCRAEATYIQRWNSDSHLSRYDDKTIEIGGGEKYSPRCEEHFIKPLQDGSFLKENQISFM